MKAHRLVALIAIAELFTGQLRAGVRVVDAPAKEKLVAFRTGDKSFITANPGLSLDLSGMKVGSKQTFTLIDINGNELEDGDEVRIRYTPNTAGKPDPSKASYWVEVTGGVKRGHEGDAFKIKLVEKKYALQTQSGKFVGKTTGQGVLGISDSQEGALLWEIVDVSAEHQ